MAGNRKPQHNDTISYRGRGGRECFGKVLTVGKKSVTVCCFAPCRVETITFKDIKRIEVKK